MEQIAAMAGLHERAESSQSEGVDDRMKMPPGAPIVKKPLGLKEATPFKWKLVGESGGLVLTLFTAIERGDVEAQLERLSNDGYYRDLRILGADDAIRQS